MEAEVCAVAQRQKLPPRDLEQEDGRLHRVDSILWPAIVDIDSARRAANASSIVSALIAVMIVVLLMASIGLTLEPNPRRAWALVDVGLWLAIAVGIRRMSRIAAISALLLIIWTSVRVDLATWLFILPAMVLIGGVRAVFFFRRQQDLAEAN